MLGKACAFVNRFSLNYSSLTPYYSLRASHSVAKVSWGGYEFLAGFLSIIQSYSLETYVPSGFHAAEPFDSDQFLFELKVDAFRSLAFIESGKCELVSRNRNTFRGFAELADWLGNNIRVENAVIDGEIACVDESGRPQFRDLL